MPDPKPKDPAAVTAWTAGIVGPRGAAAIDHTKRGPVKYWLRRAHSFPTGYVDGLTVSALASCWNDTTDASIAAHQRIAADWLTTQDGKTTTTTTEEDHDMTQQGIRFDTAGPRRVIEHDPIPSAHEGRRTYRDDNDDAEETEAQAIARAVAAALSARKPAGIDAQAVRQIVAEEAGAAIDAATPHTLASVRQELAQAITQIETLPRAITVRLGDHQGRTLPKRHRHQLFDTALTITANNLPVALIGPAGSGKTTLAEHIAEALGLPFYMLGALTGTHELLGYLDAAGNYHGTPFRQAFEHGGVFLLDEVDGSDPAVPLAMNSAIANGWQPFPDAKAPVRRHADFRILAGANTYWTGADRVYVGRNQLDGATLDRFAMLDQGYDESLERQLAGLDLWTNYVQAVRRAVADQKVRHIVSMRASINGATMLRAGLAPATVSAAILWKGLSADTIRKIENALPHSIRTAVANYVPPKETPKPHAITTEAKAA